MSPRNDSDVEMRSGSESSDVEDVRGGSPSRPTKFGYSMEFSTAPMKAGPTLSAQGAPVQRMVQGMEANAYSTRFGNNDCGAGVNAVLAGKSLLAAASPERDFALGAQRWAHIDTHQMNGRDYSDMAQANGYPVTRYYPALDSLRLPAAGQAAAVVHNAHMTILARSESGRHAHHIDPQQLHITTYPVERVPSERADRVPGTYQAYVQGHTSNGAAGPSQQGPFGQRRTPSPSRAMDRSASPDPQKSPARGPFGSRGGKAPDISR